MSDGGSVLQRLETKVDTLIVQVATLIAHTDSSSDVIKDHESRIRRLEKWRYAWPSTAVLTVIVATATLLYYLTR